MSSTIHTDEFCSSQANTVDDILRSLQQSQHHHNGIINEAEVSDMSEGGGRPDEQSSAAVTDWYSCLSDREKRVLERLSLFEGRVEALQSMKEELYQSLVGQQEPE